MHSNVHVRPYITYQTPPLRLASSCMQLLRDDTTWKPQAAVASAPAAGVQQRLRSVLGGQRGSGPAAGRQAQRHARPAHHALQDARACAKALAQRTSAVSGCLN